MTALSYCVLDGEIRQEPRSATIRRSSPAPLDVWLFGLWQTGEDGHEYRIKCFVDTHARAGLQVAHMKRGDYARITGRLSVTPYAAPEIEVQTVELDLEREAPEPPARNKKRKKKQP